MRYANPNTEGSLVSFKDRYDNFINGEYRAPSHGKYFENVSQVTGKVFCEIARSTKEDVEAAVEAGNTAQDAWGKTTVAERANRLKKSDERIAETEERLEDR